MRSMTACTEANLPGSHEEKQTGDAMLAKRSSNK